MENTRKAPRNSARQMGATPKVKAEMEGKGKVSPEQKLLTKKEETRNVSVGARMARYL